MSSPYLAILSSPLGKLGLIAKDEKLSKIDFLPATSQPYIHDQLGKQFAKEFERYFANSKHRFQLATQLEGTPFQLQVWQALQKIPHGETWTYGQLAKKLQTAPRAIGQACRTNPIPIIIPCHRIVAANHLGGYSGHVKGRFMNVKTWLLQHEDALDNA